MQPDISRSHACCTITKCRHRLQTPLQELTTAKKSDESTLSSRKWRALHSPCCIFSDSRLVVNSQTRRRRSSFMHLRTTRSNVTCIGIYNRHGKSASVCLDNLQVTLGNWQWRKVCKLLATRRWFLRQIIAGITYLWGARRAMDGLDCASEGITVETTAPPSWSRTICFVEHKWNVHHTSFMSLPRQDKSAPIAYVHLGIDSQNVPRMWSYPAWYKEACLYSERMLVVYVVLKLSRV
jgi:hypothetical protein